MYFFSLALNFFYFSKVEDRNEMVRYDMQFSKVLGDYFNLFLSLFSLRDGQTELGRDSRNVFAV